MSKELKKAYKRIKENYTSARDAFYDTDKKDFHLIVSAECLAYADCMLIIAEEITEIDKQPIK